jgi:hypothetical protein
MAWATFAFVAAMHWKGQAALPERYDPLPWLRPVPVVTQVTSVHTPSLFAGSLWLTPSSFT